MSIGQRLKCPWVYALAGALWGGTAHANGYLESQPWQFQTSTDKANKAVIVDIMERKKGGYYDSFQINNTYNYNTSTRIGRQVNCEISASAVGNHGTNGMTANSPTISPGAQTDANTTGNSATNRVGGGGGSGQIGSDQSNAGSTLTSGVTNSSTSASSGPVTIGSSSQVLNSDQTNSGNQIARVSDSQACGFAAGALN